MYCMHTDRSQHIYENQEVITREYHKQRQKVEERNKSKSLAKTRKVRITELDKPDKSSSEENAPDLPDRGYLEDIDFVCQEFDLIFGRTPDIPTCTAIEDETDKAKEKETEITVTAEAGTVVGEQPEETESATAKEMHYQALIIKLEASSVYQSLSPRMQSKSSDEECISGSEKQYQKLSMKPKDRHEYQCLKPRKITKMSEEEPTLSESVLQNQYQPLQKKQNAPRIYQSIAPEEKPTTTTATEQFSQVELEESTSDVLV